MKVLGARCIVREIKNSDTTTSGIVIPGQDKKPTNKGIVIAVGDGAMLEDGRKVPVDLKVGDTVIYSAFAGSPIVVSDKHAKKDGEEEFIVLNERDILAVIE